MLLVLGPETPLTKDLLTRENQKSFFLLDFKLHLKKFKNQVDSGELIRK